MTPTHIIAGDTTKFTISNNAYPATIWTLKLALRGASALNVTASPTGSAGTDHGFTITPVQSSTLQPGLYEYAAQAISGSEAYTIASGRITVTPNLMNAAAGDRLSHAQTMLTVIESVLQGTVTANQAQYTIGGRSVIKLSVPELMKLRARYAHELFTLKTGVLNKDIAITFNQV